ncbi:MAG: hypothetical protein U1C71_00305, partial [archaeon]|nr:hypothetical protein [archaeon]
MPYSPAILESVRKLVRMGLERDELVKELQAMGLTHHQAEEVYRDAHREQMETAAHSHESKEKPISSDASLPAHSSPHASSQPSSPPHRGTMRAPSAHTSTLTLPTPPSFKSNVDLWEKGILDTVNSKLVKMEQLEKSIDDAMEARIQQHVKALEKKMETLFESQRDLMSMRIEGQLNAKSRDMDGMLTQKIEEIKTLNLATQEDLQRIKGQRMILQDLVADFSTKVEGLDSLRRSILDDVNTKLDDIESRVNDLVSSTEEKLRDVETRATHTLELEQKITSGLADQLQQQANQILEARVKDLRDDMQDEIIQLKKLGADLASRDVQEVLKEFADLTHQLDAAKAHFDDELATRLEDVDEKINGIDKIVNTKMDTLIHQKTADFDVHVKTQMDEFNASKKELGQKLMEADTRMQSLDMFQKQFIASLRKANMERED